MGDLNDLAHSLAQLADEVEHPHLQEAVQQVKDELAIETQNNFYQSCDPNGQPWPDPVVPLGHPLLVDTGFLMVTAVGQIHSAQATDSGFEASPAWGPDYGLYQQEGTPNLPERPFTGWGEQFLDHSTEMLISAWVRNLERA